MPPKRRRRKLEPYKPLPVNGSYPEQFGDPYEWPVFQFRPTAAQVEAEVALEKNHTVVFVAANRSGKTTSKVNIFTRACLGEFRWAKPPVHVAIVSLAKHQAASALQEKIREFILSLPEDMIVSRTTREMLTSPIEFWNGSTMSIKTSEMGWQRMQGAGYDLVGFDEHPDQHAVQEMAVRIRRGRRLRTFFAFTPTEGISWFYRDVVQGEHQDGIATISSSIFENGDPPCTVCKRERKKWDASLNGYKLSRTAENHDRLKELCARCHTFGVEPGIPASEITRLETIYKGPDLAVRFYGEWANVQGDRVFTLDEIDAMRRGCTEGYAQAGVVVYKHDEEGHPIIPPAHPYTIGVDCAEGLGGERDESVITVLDAVDGEQVLVWGDNSVGVDQYFAEVLNLSKQYNNAMVWFERIQQGLVLKEMLAPHRVNLYRQRRAAKRGFVQTDEIGFYPGLMSRDRILRQLVQALRMGMVKSPDGKLHVRPHQGAVVIRDIKTVEQLEVLFYNQKKGNKIQVPFPWHDDRVLALAGAHEARMARTWRSPSVEHAPNRLEEWAAGLDAGRRSRHDRGMSIHPYFLRT